MATTTQKSHKPGGQIRAALYSRVSTGLQSVEMQLVELRQAAAQRGWTVMGEFVDEGISGSTASRPTLDKLLNDCRLGKIDVVAVWKIDRLGRSLQNLLQILDELTSLGVQFVSLHDAGFDSTSPSGKLMISVIGAFSAYELAIIQERCRAGVARAQAAGVHCGRPRHDLDLRAAKALLGQGHSLRQVASMLSLPRGTLARRLGEEGVSLTPPPQFKGGSKVRLAQGL